MTAAYMSVPAHTAAQSLRVLFPEENIHKMSIAFTVNTAANTAEEAEAAAGGRKALSVILSVRNLVDAIIKAHNENIVMTGIIMWTARHSVSVVRKAE